MKYFLIYSDSGGDWSLITFTTIDEALSFITKSMNISDTMAPHLSKLDNYRLINGAAAISL